MIKKHGGNYVLYTQDGQHILGRHKTEADAKRQEAAINISKARQNGVQVPKRGKR